MWLKDKAKSGKLRVKKIHVLKGNFKSFSYC